MFHRLDSTPDKSDPYLWADFAELRALLSINKCFSRGDLSGIEHRNKDMGEVTFNVENKWRDITSFVGIRVADFNGVYPFEISQDGDTLACSSDAAADCYAPYLSLLLCSNLRHIKKTHTTELTKKFEEISLCVFKHLMPNGSEIRPTWASGGEDAPYKGNLYSKLTQMAKDLRCSATFEEKDFKPTDTGDGGVDIIAWHPMGDNRTSIPIAWAQCGCSKDQWVYKQLESSPTKSSHLLPVRHPWANYYFMPFDMREPAEGDWANKSDIAAVILVDRLRLLRLAKDFGELNNFPEVSLVAEALNAEH